MRVALRECAGSAVEKAFCVIEGNPQPLCNGIFGHYSEKIIQLENISNNGMNNLKLRAILAKVKPLDEAETAYHNQLSMNLIP
ncbi:hypothetical protein TNCV_1680961 [Trichonephila clavipes]|nr:hypothetical protein TNCV_1680961 [Trichonephila clavipes]